MSMGLIILWISLGLLGVLIAGLGAGLETGVYSLNRVRLHVQDQQGRPNARLLAKDLLRPGALIASLLILHNSGIKLATYAGAMLLHDHGLSHWQIIIIDMMLVMPLLFIFAETLPKDIFATFTDDLLYRFARPMRLLIWVGRITLILPMMLLFSQAVMWLLGMRGQLEPFAPKDKVQMLVNEGVGVGLLSDDQSAMVDRVLDLGDRTVEMEMVPWHKVLKVMSCETTSRLWQLAHETSHSRFPVVDGLGQLKGKIELFDVISLQKDSDQPIDGLITPLVTCSVGLSLRQGLALLQQQHQAMAVVVDAQNKPVGIVTLKDLIEPITGELASW